MSTPTLHYPAFKVWRGMKIRMTSDLDHSGIIVTSNSPFDTVNICPTKRQSYSIHGDRRSHLGSKGRSPGEFMRPCQTVLSANGAVLAVADSGNNRIQLFNAKTRNFLASFGRKGKIRPGCMQGPEGIAFVSGYQEMVVADTGNNRIQIFHVDQLAIPPKAPFGEALNTSSDKRIRNSSRSGGFASSSTTTAARPSSDTRSLMGWVQARAQAQPLARNSVGKAELGEFDGGQSLKFSRGESFREAISRGGKESDYCDHAKDCLLIFNGGENIGRLSKRRTAGESEDGEGPLRQPCDLSFWRASKGGEDTPWAWKPAVPPWFRFLDGGDANADEAESSVQREPLNDSQSDLDVKVGTLAEGLSSSLGDTKQNRVKHPSVPEDSTRPGRGSQGRSGSACDTSSWEDIAETSTVGSFVVRETRTPGELHLVFVDRTKEALEAAEARKNAQEDIDSIPAASNSGSDRESEGYDLMAYVASSEQESSQLESSHNTRLTRASAEAPGGGDDENSSLSLLPVSNIPEFEVRCKSITVLDEARKVEIDGQTYGSLLVLLRAFRGRGFPALLGVVDTRGDRGIVAVAERGGGRNLGSVDVSTVGNPCYDGRAAALVVATSDGVVRALAGPVHRNCGNFAGLQNDTALSIFEMLGYRSSQVLGYVNRTTAEIRARLPREWRLYYPLTQGHLATIKMEFLHWGRRVIDKTVVGQGLPGRGTAFDAAGVKLRNYFLANSKCLRPACPYSHEYSRIEDHSEHYGDAYILFRGGATHALNNLYGQVFVWEWEGELHRLFQDRSMTKTMLKRYDPMTLGMYGAEAVRDCVEEKHQVLDFPGFIDFATVIHDNVTGLRHWNQRSVDRSTTSAMETLQQRDIAPPSNSGEGLASPQNRKLTNPTPLDHDNAAEAAGCGDEGGDLMASSAGGSANSPPNGFHSFASTKTPWLSWDSIRHIDRPRNAAAFSLRSERTKSSRRGRDGDEEVKVNRIYGSTEDERAASVNKIMAFQADRVVRVLDDLF